LGHKPHRKPSCNPPVFSKLSVAIRVPSVHASREEEFMETMLQSLVIIGGLTFSLAASLLIEELIFGRIVRLAFAPRPAEFSVPSSQFSVTAMPSSVGQSQTRPSREEPRTRN
jgi:hypothetical protein